MKKTQKIIGFCNNKNIIVVGNSGKVLMSQKRGDFIDAHDVIVRFNYGYPEEKYQSYIGKKTTIWLCALNRKKDQRKYYNLFKNEIEFVMQPYIRINKSLIDELKEEIISVPMKFYIDAFCKMNAHLKNPKEHMYKKDKKLAAPTSGSIFLNFLVNEIKYTHLSIVGFDFLKSNNFNLNRGHSNQHKTEAEEKFISDLILTYPNCTFLK